MFNIDYIDRVIKYFTIINPKYSVINENYINHILTNGNEYQKYKIKESVIHKDTNKPIYWLFRFSSFIPVNIPICFGLITSKTIYGQMFWQVINQSYNVGFNYANKPHSKNINNNDLINMYTFAVVSSCSISGIVSYYTKFIFNNTNNHFFHTLCRGFFPFTSVFLSSTLNLYFVRKNDFENGIKLVDKNNNEAGKSINMAYNSFTETATCRTMFRFMSCMFPPIIEYIVMKNSKIENIMKNNIKLWTFFRLGIITTCLYISMPLSFSFYPQMMKINNNNIEPEFKNKELFYNRGI